MTTITTTVAAPIELAHVEHEQTGLLSKEQRAEIHARWKIAANAKSVTSAQHAAFTLLMGRSLNRAFTPISNPAKIISNSNNPFNARDNALSAVERGRAEAFAPWADLLSGVKTNAYGSTYEGSHEILAAAKAAVVTFRAAQ